jgi:hypothetical protein
MSNRNIEAIGVFIWWVVFFFGGLLVIATAFPDRDSERVAIGGILMVIAYVGILLELPAHDEEKRAGLPLSGLSEAGADAISRLHKETARRIMDIRLHQAAELLEAREEGAQALRKCQRRFNEELQDICREHAREVMELREQIRQLELLAGGQDAVQ